jgi:cytochrome c-type biogenesis protein
MNSLGNFPYLASFIAGVFTFVSPCVLPLIPVYISFISGVSVTELDSQKGTAQLKTFLSALFFVLGFSFIFVMLGASASYFGGLFRTHRDLIRWIGGGAVIIFGLHMSGIFRINLFYREKRLNIETFKSKYFGKEKRNIIEKPTSVYLWPFIVGMAFAAGWTPCIGPILSSILILASTQDSVYKGIILLSLYSVGLGLPFLLTALFVEWALGLFKRIKMYFGYIEAASGAVLVCVGLLIITDNLDLITRFVSKLIG